MIEVIVPQLCSVRRGDIGRVFTLDPDHVGIETFDGLVGQIAWSPLDGDRRTAGAPFGLRQVRLAVNAGPDGQDRRLPPPGPLGGWDR